MSKQKYLVRLNKADQQLEQAQSDLEYINKFIKKLKSIDSNTKELSHYYQNEWMDDVDKHSKKQGVDYHPSASQDGIWNVLQDQYNAKLDLMKVIINEITTK